MAAHLILPAGPGDYRERLEYLESRGGGGIELKTMRVGETWALEALRIVKAWRRSNPFPVTWHVHDDVTWRFGFADFNMKEYFRQISVVDRLLDEGLDGIVHHCGTLRWVNSYDPSLSFAERYVSWFSCREILDQMNRQIDRFGMLVGRYGGRRIFIENTPLTLGRDITKPGPDGKPVLVDLVNFLPPQVGTPAAVCYMADQVGAGNYLDTGHFNEFWAFVMRLYDFVVLGRNILKVNSDELVAQRKLLHRGASLNVKGQIPCIPPDSDQAKHNLLWYIQNRRFRGFHLDACRASLVGGKPDCDRPVLTDYDAKFIHLDEIIRAARANDDCLGMMPENVGSDVWPMATERPTDWEGKRRTFEFVQEAIANLK